MTTEVYNQENKKTGTIELPKAVFDVKWNPDLVHQAVVIEQANRRQPLAHAKNRAEVRGGGRKPWRQKGTGRARHGSSRSPLWVGGGVTFGPRNEKIFAKKINRKMKQQALFSVLSRKLADQEVKIIDDLDIEKRKTKAVAALAGNFFGKKTPTTAFIVAAANKTFSIAARNIPGFVSFRPGALSVYGLLSRKYVFIEKKAVDEIINHYRR